MRPLSCDPPSKEFKQQIFVWKHIMSRLIAQLREIDLGTFKPPSDSFNVNLEAEGAAIDSAGVQLERFISNTIGTITIIAGLAFLLYFVFGALQWILAGGDQGKIDQAKKQMTNGAIGLVIIIVAYAIIGVIGSVLGLNILNPAEEIIKLNPMGNI